MRTYEADEWSLEGALSSAMHAGDLTYGEAVAMLQLTRGQTPCNTNPGVFKNMEPLKE